MTNDMEIWSKCGFIILGSFLKEIEDFSSLVRVLAEDVHVMFSVYRFFCAQKLLVWEFVWLFQLNLYWVETARGVFDI